MSGATTVKPAAVVAGAQPAALEAYRDDGPVAELLGRALGSRLPLPSVVVTGLAALPMVVVTVATLLGAAAGSLPGLPIVAAALAWHVVLAGAARGRPHSGRLAWLVPPVLRAVEYSGLLLLAARAGAVALGFALLGVLAFHHYDTVYRLRHQRLAPPRWLVRGGGGWDGRLLAALLALLLGVLAPALLVAAVVLGAVYVVESARGWLRFSAAARPALYADEEDEDE